MSDGATTQIGPYAVIGELGRGGMGVVYEARHTQTGRAVALKVLQASARSSSVRLQRFQREAELARRLQHPGIVSVLDSGRSPGARPDDPERWWIAMELIEGRPLAESPVAEDMDWRRAAELVRDVADALGHAHAKGILHRDVKPGNILIDAVGRPRLTDFGLAKHLAADAKLTQAGETLGTPSYMSPEQARGENESLTPTSDVWALGCVLYRLLAGHSPFRGESSAVVFGKVLTEPPEPLEHVRSDLPRSLYRVIAAALDRNPARRPEHGYAFRDAIESVLRGSEPIVGPRPAGGVRPLLWIVGGAAIAIAIGATLWSLRDGGQAVVPSPGTGRDVSDHEPSAESFAARARDVAEVDSGEAVRLYGEALRLDPERHEWRLRIGLMEWARGRNSHALVAWETIPAEAPEGSLAMLYRGLEAHFRWIGEGFARDEARPLLERAARTNDGRARRLAQAALKWRRRDRREALELLDGITGWEAALLRASAVDDSGDHAGAIREYDAALSHGIAFAWAYVNRAALHRDLRSYDAALADYDRALQIHPGMLRALVGRGMLHYRRGEREAAGRDHDLAIELHRRSPEAWVWRAYYRVERRRYANALADLDEALRLDPSYAPALTERGYCLLKLNRPADALASLDRSLRVRPGNLTTHRYRGMAYYELRKPAEALADLDAVLAVQPRQSSARYYRSLVHSLRRQPAKALQDLSVAIDVRPDQARFHYARGGVRLDLEDRVGAEADYTEVLRIQPDHLQARTNRSYVRRKRGNLVGALIDADEVIRRDPTFLKAWYNRARALQASGDLPGAVDAQREAVRVAPRSGYAQMLLGELLHESGGWRAALRAFEAAQRLGVSSRYRKRFERGLAASRHRVAAMNARR